MNAPRIRVFADATGYDDVPCFVWYCNDGPKLGPVCAGGETWTIDDAATEGMKHLAERHAEAAS